MNNSTVSAELEGESNGKARAHPKAAGWVDRATGRLDQTRRPIARKLRSTAEAIRQQAQSLFERESISEGVSDAVHGAAERVDSSAEYLESHDVSQMARDAAGVIKRNPVPSLLIAIAVGFLCGRALRRS